MEFLEQFVHNFKTVLALPISLNHPFSLLYLGSATIIAFLIYIKVERKNEESLIRGFVHYCFPRYILTHASTKVDISFFIVNNTLGIMLMAPLFISSAFVAFTVSSLLESVFGLVESGIAVNLGSQIAMSFVAVLAADLGLYVAHYLFHKSDFLWEFHKVHHSAEVLTPVTNHRIHPLQTIITHTFSGIGVGTVLGVFDYLYAYSIEPLLIVGVNLFSLGFIIITGNLTHSHIWWSFGPVLSKIFISPAQHQIHHSSALVHRDKNFGGGFALWDTLFCTLYTPKEKEDLVFGLGNNEDKDYRSIWRLYALPFYKASQIVLHKMPLKDKTPAMKVDSPSTNSQAGKKYG